MTVLVSKDMEAARDDSSGVSRYGAVRDNGSGVSSMGSGLDKGQRDFVLKLLKLIVPELLQANNAWFIILSFAAMALSDEKRRMYKKKRRVYKRRGGCTKRKEGVQNIRRILGTGSIKSI